MYLSSCLETTLMDYRQGQSEKYFFIVLGQYFFSTAKTAMNQGCVYESMLLNYGYSSFLSTCRFYCQDLASSMFTEIRKLDHSARK